MLLKCGNITLRDAEASDAARLAAWWNDGAVMAHAGFPNGLGTTAEEIASSLEKDRDGERRRLIIELDGEAIGEMSYRKEGAAADIGIKICDASKREKGIGKTALSLLIAELFRMGFGKIVLDTDLENLRAQHVYERLGFRRLRINSGSWRDQLGQVRSSVYYELVPEDFISFAE